SLELRKLLGRFIDVCEAMEYAHSRGVVHRDLKPANIMLGHFGETLVVDWGLAKATGRPESSVAPDQRPLAPSIVGPELTRTHEAVGTPAYMSPEQAKGRLDLVGPASDVYSLGATLYHLVTGRPPFGGDDLGALLRSVARGEFLSPRSLDRRIPRP